MRWWWIQQPAATMGNVEHSDHFKQFNGSCSAVPKGSADASWLANKRLKASRVPVVTLLFHLSPHPHVQLICENG